MADSKHFRVIVDLSAFFCDHRRVARVFVKSNLKRVVDLQTRISEIFEINEFYLTTGGHFLPASEDIRVLNNNETVCVIPYQPQRVQRVKDHSAVTSSTPQKEHKKEKIILEVIPENSGETSTPKKKKRKKKNVLDIISSSSEDVPCKKKKSENRESTKSDKKKNKHKSENADPKPSSSSCENENAQNKKLNQSIVEKQICNFESSQKINDLKRKLQQKTYEYINSHSQVASCNSTEDASNMKEVLPKLRSHINNCNDLGRSTMPDTVRLSRHVDTPIKAFKHYVPPPRITDRYLAQNKVNIVKIDIVKNENQDLNGQTNLSQSFASSDNTVETCNKSFKNPNFSQILNVSTPQKNYVKEVVSSFEKNISPESKENIYEEEMNQMDEKISELKESEASNSTKEFLNTKNVSPDNMECATDVSVNVGVQPIDIVSAPNVSVNESKYLESLVDPLRITTLTEEIKPTYVSMNLSSIAQDSSYLSGNSKESSLNTTNTSLNLNNSSARSKNTASDKKFAGVGSLLERLRESDSVISHESDTSGQYVTKRKRIRKHRRKNKKNDDGKKTAPLKIDTPIAKPLNIKACPILHIKFDDNEMDILEDKSLTVSDINNENVVQNGSTVNKENIPNLVDEPSKLDKTGEKSFVMETLTLSDENDDPIMEHKSIFGKDSISRAPLMTNQIAPKVGDVIAFKILKMTNDYTPQLSDYIVGKLEIYLLETKTVFFKILDGEDQLLPPSGKFTLKEDVDVESSKYKEFSWTELITPKLLYP